MKKTANLQLSAMPKAYNFIINPYPDVRLSKCPFCDGKTGQRKRPLVVHIDPQQLISLNYTCRFCKKCDLLMAHKDEIEHLLTTLFQQHNPTLIGNEYLIMGTIERKIWQASMKLPMMPQEMLSYLQVFKEVYTELRMLQQGWFPIGVEPPIRQPPPSTEWVKA